MKAWVRYLTEKKLFQNAVLNQSIKRYKLYDTYQKVAATVQTMADAEMSPHIPMPQFKQITAG